MKTTPPLPPLSDDVLDGIDPSVRGLVVTLRDHGFNTIDSGDGVTPKDCETNPVPHVIMQVDPSQLVAEADRLVELVASWGLASLNTAPDGQGIDACYLPASKRAHLVLWGMTDAVLP